MLKEITAGDLVRILKNSTVPHAIYLDIQELIKNMEMPLSHVLSARDLEHIAALTRADAEELKDLTGLR